MINKKTGNQGEIDIVDLVSCPNPKKITLCAGLF